MFASSEAATVRDGLFSYAAEAHAAILGATAGWGLRHPSPWIRLATLVLVSSPKARSEARREPWYGAAALAVAAIATERYYDDADTPCAK